MTTTKNKEQKATKRAKELLVELANEHENWMYDNLNFISAISSETKSVFLITDPTKSFAIIRLPCLTRYCVQSKYKDYPVEDIVIAIKSLIETDEEEFLRIANVQGRTRHRSSEMPSPYYEYGGVSLRRAPDTQWAWTTSSAALSWSSSVTSMTSSSTYPGTWITFDYHDHDY